MEAIVRTDKETLKANKQWCCQCCSWNLVFPFLIFLCWSNRIQSLASFQETTTQQVKQNKNENDNKKDGCFLLQQKNQFPTCKPFLLFLFHCINSIYIMLKMIFLFLFQSNFIHLSSWYLSGTWVSSSF